MTLKIETLFFFFSIMANQKSKESLMEEIDLVAESIKFMFLGMGVVFSFLIVLVYILKIQAQIIQKYFYPSEQSKSATSQNNTKG